jgi:5-dehydro-2-deoxygluconokinase
MQRFYDLGVRPDWWKLEPVADAGVWRHIAEVIADNDPLCRGVVLLGLAAPEAELLEAFAVATRFDCVKGFAVGRTIFQEVAEQWLTGGLDDEGAMAAMASRLGRLVEGWRSMQDAARSVEQKDDVA